MRGIDFFNQYGLNGVDVLKIYPKEKDLCFLIEMDVDIELIANGYRPSLEMKPKHLLIFKNVNINLKDDRVQYIKKYKYQDGEFSVELNLSQISFKVSEVEIIPNIMFL